MTKTSILLIVALLSIQFSLQQSDFLSLENSNASYDAQLAKKLWKFSKLAYCKSDIIQKWSYSKICNEFPGATDITLFYNSTADNQGYTFYLPSDNVVYLVFRGTDPWSFKNLIQDINTFYADYDKCDGCNVHAGFYSGYKQMRDQVQKAIKSLQQKHSGSKLIITGHSLGASLAILAAADLKSFTNIDTLYTYGLPRVGNPSFQKWFDNAGIVDNFVARITHHDDPIPHLPPQEFGFRHTNTEIYYNSDSSSYKACGEEDYSCSNKFLITIDILAHQSYMGEELTSDIIVCGILKDEQEQ